MYKQSGVALIMVMLIIALATTTAVSMVSRQFLDIHRSKNVLHFEQAYQHAYSAEFVAKEALIDSYNNNNQLTTLGDFWNTPAAGELEGVMMSGFIEDLQARFNINSIVNGNQIQQVQFNRFQQLLTNFNIPPEFAYKVADWIDTDQVIRTNSAEDDVYLNKVPAYTTAGQPIADISELLLIDGMTADMYDRLKDYVCALDSSIRINVNTASSEVIRSLAGISTTSAQAEALTSARGVSGFANVPDFLNDPLFSQQTPPVSQDGLNVTSQYFRLTTYFKIGEIEVVFTSNLIRRINNNVATVALLNRSRSIL